MTRSLPRRRPRFALACAAFALCAPPPARAAGGHHSVDDASVLDPGQCQVEAWADGDRDGVRTLAHLGPTCRFGPVEWGLNLDRVRAGDAAATLAGVQAKWARELAPGIAVGASLAATAQDRSPRYVGSAVTLLASWQAAATLAVHANAGRDLWAEVPSTNRGGIAAEWTPVPAALFVAELFHEGRASNWRAGGRWIASPAFSVDLSRAHTLERGTSWWTLGVTWASIADRLDAFLMPRRPNLAPS